MRKSAVLTTMLDHQQRILGHIAGAESLVEAQAQPDIAAMACRRWQLARLLREYQIFKHRVVFDPTIAGADPDLSEDARQMKARCIAMGEVFRQHTLRWSGGAAADRWGEYVRAVLALIAALRAHIRREAATIAALLAHPRYVEGR